MGWNDTEDDTLYQVIINHEEQYSIWPEDRAVPEGWKADGKSGSRADCLDHIRTVRTDMRPMSLRLRMRMDVPSGHGN